MTTAPSTAMSEARNAAAGTARSSDDDVLPEWVLSNPSFSRTRPVFQSETAAEIFRLPVAERSPEQASQVVEWLQSVWHVARKIGVKKTTQVVAHLKYQRVDAGTTICAEGEHGEEFYIILSGVVVVTKQAVGKVAVLRTGHSFGELALTVHEASRSATCTATEDTELLVLHKRDFEHFALEVQLAERREALACLTQCPLFAGWKRSRLEEVCNLVHRRSFVPGEYIYRQGQKSDFLYVILEGEVDIIKEEKITVTNRWPVAVDEWREVVHKRIKPVRQRTLSPPHCLGELVLVGATRRTTSARARVNTTLLTLDKHEFVHLLRPSRDSDGFEHVRILAEDGSYEDEVLLKALDAMLINLGEQVPALDYTYSDLYAWSKQRPATAPAAKGRPQSARETARRSARRQHDEQPCPLTSRLAPLPAAQAAELPRHRPQQLFTNERHLRSFQAKLLSSAIASPPDSTSEAQAEPVLDGVHRGSIVVAKTLKRVRTEPMLARRRGDQAASQSGKQDGKQRDKRHEAKQKGEARRDAEPPLRHHATAANAHSTYWKTRVGRRDRMTRSASAAEPRIAFTRKPGSRVGGKLGRSRAEHKRDVIAQALQDHFYLHQLGASQDTAGHRKAMLLANTTTAPQGRSKSLQAPRPNR